LGEGKALKGQTHREEGREDRIKEGRSCKIQVSEKRGRKINNLIAYYSEKMGEWLRGV